MLDTMAEGRLIVGMLRGTTNEMLTYDLNPEESRERTDEGMELILRADIFSVLCGIFVLSHDRAYTPVVVRGGAVCRRPRPRL